MPARRVVEHERPDHVAVALDDRVRAAETVRLFRVQRGMDAAEDHRRPSGPRERADFVSAKRVAGVNAHAHDVAGLDRLEVEGLQGFVRDPRTPIRRRSRRSQGRTAIAA